jgi:F-type H+-transporting ATPase subunit b
MKPANIKSFFGKIIFTVLLLIISTSTLAWATDQGSGWRPIFDTVMMWVNFGILAFLIVKFGRKPIKMFLKGQKEVIAEEIDELEKEKSILIAKTEAIQQALIDSDTRFQELKTRIIKQGENKKEAIIHSAQQHYKLMIASSKNKIENQIQAAKRELCSEMVDRAITMATEKLPQTLTASDERNIEVQYIDKATST